MLRVTILRNTKVQAAALMAIWAFGVAMLMTA